MMQNVMTNAALWRIHPFWGQSFFRSVGFSETGFCAGFSGFVPVSEKPFFYTRNEAFYFDTRFLNCMKEDVKA